MNTKAHATRASLDEWVDRLSRRDMPVLGHTVRQLCHISADDKASASDLAGVVLRDAAMTSGVLKLSNSAYYNAGSYEISTISRAVILLGFDTVRSIGLSLAVIDNLLTPPARTRVVELMRQAVYAAAQAKNIAVHRGDAGAEEIFIATLLYRLGDMAFWSFANENELRALDGTEHLSADAARQREIEALGFSLRQLSVALARAWSLGDVLSDALQPNVRDIGPRSKTVLLGHELETAVRRFGWNSDEVAAVIERVARHAGIPPGKADALIESSRRELDKAAHAFGLRLDPAATPAPPQRPARAVREADPLLQLKVLRELSALLQKGPNLQVVLDMVMEGIFRGIGMDRAALAVLAPDRASLRVKYVLGEDQGQLRDSLALSLSEKSADPFRRALTERRSSWLSAADGGFAEAAADGCDGQFLVGALVVKGKEIGMIYADRQPSGRGFAQDDFDAFCHFIDQANLALEHLMRR